MQALQTVLVVLTVLVSILLIIVVLIQKSKGGGLASNFASSNQIMGVRRTNDFIEKTTWGLAVVILLLSVFSSIISPKRVANDQQIYATEDIQTEATNFSTNVDDNAGDAASLPVVTPNADAQPDAGN